MADTRCKAGIHKNKNSVSSIFPRRKKERSVRRFSMQPTSSSDFKTPPTLVLVVWSIVFNTLGSFLPSIAMIVSTVFLSRVCPANKQPLSFYGPARGQTLSWRSYLLAAAAALP